MNQVASGTAINIDTGEDDTIIDYNFYHNSASDPVKIVPTAYSLAAFCSGGFGECNGKVGDAELASNYKPKSTSPVIDAGADLSAYFSTDKDGITRPQEAKWDIGVYEYINVAPLPPTNIRALN